MRLPPGCFCTTLCLDRATALCLDRATALCLDRATALCLDRATALCLDRATALRFDRATALRFSHRPYRLATSDDRLTARLGRSALGFRRKTTPSLRFCPASRFDCPTVDLTGATRARLAASRRRWSRSCR
ncbi:MAG: hypothetical protein ACR2OV_16190 [Hyphomicrobiaceae bacterium]